MVRRLQHQRWGKSWFILCHEILVRTVVYPSPQHSTRCDIWLWLTLLARGDLSTLSAGVCYQRFLLLLSFQLFQPFAALMLSCSEQQEKNKDRGKKKTAAAFRYSCPTPTWCLANPLTSPWVCPRNPYNSAPVTRGSAKKHDEQGEQEKSIWLWNKKRWEVSGEHNGGFVMESWWVHGESTLTLVSGLDVNHRATETTSGLFVWGNNFKLIINSNYSIFSIVFEI